MAGSGLMILASMTVTLLVTTQVTVVQMTSDPDDLFCEVVCWEENALAEQCLLQTNCNGETLPDDEYYQCSNVCYANVSRCQMMCRRNAQRLLDRCLPRCTNIDSYEHCLLNCFTDQALRMKNRRQNRVTNQ